MRRRHIRRDAGRSGRGVAANWNLAIGILPALKDGEDVNSGANCSANCLICTIFIFAEE